MNVLTKLKISFYLEMYETNKGLRGSQNGGHRFWPACSLGSLQKLMKIGE